MCIAYKVLLDLMFLSAFTRCERARWNCCSVRAAGAKSSINSSFFCADEAVALGVPGTSQAFEPSVSSLKLPFVFFMFQAWVGAHASNDVWVFRQRAQDGDAVVFLSFCLLRSRFGVFSLGDVTCDHPSTRPTPAFWLVRSLSFFVCFLCVACSICA